MRLKDRICIVTGAAQGIGAATVAKLAAEGATVLPLIDGAMEMTGVIVGWEARWVWRNLARRYPEAMSASLKERLARADALTPETFRMALLKREDMRRRHAELMADCDAVIALSSPGIAPESGPVGGTAPRTTGAATCNAFTSAIGMPALTMPLLCVDGLPLGVQLCGPHHGDHVLTGLAAWVAAVSRVLARDEIEGSLSFLITGDEEGPALHGTKRVVQTLAAEGEVIDACVVGEPSSQHALGDMIKIGRRGSLNTWITVHGKQGHVAYPDRAANPVPVLARLVARLADHKLDAGYEAFQPSNLELTTLDVGNTATNLIPAEARGRLNIRFNPNHTGETLMAWLNAEAGKAQAESGLRIELEHLHSGDAFLTQAGPFVTGVQDAVEASTGRRPEASTTGGTSDARFIRAMCPVLELGLVGQTMHQIDERAPVAEIEALAGVYRTVIRTYFARA